MLIYDGFLKEVHSTESAISLGENKFEEEKNEMKKRNLKNKYLNNQLIN